MMVSFCVYDLGLVFPFYFCSFKFVRFRLWGTFFCFLIWSFLFHFIGFGLTPSGLGYDGFFLFFDLVLVFPFYCLWFKSFGFRLWWIVLVFFIWGLFCHFIAHGLSPSGLGYDGFFFLIWGFLFHFIAFGLSRSCLGYHLIFFCFFDFGLLFPFYCFWFKSVGFRLWWMFFVFFWFVASFSILLPLV